MASTVQTRSLFDAWILRQAIVDSFRKLTPRRQVRNPVMFVVYVGSILTTLLWVQALVGKGEAPAWFIFWVSIWLWFTVLFANFAEAMAEGRGKAQAASLRKARGDLQAKRLRRPEWNAGFETVSASALRKGDVVRVEIGDFIPADGTIVFLLATATLLPFSLYSVAAAGQGTPVTVTVLVALLVCLIPTTIGALLSAIGIAGMDRMIQKNVIAMSGRAVEAAGDVDVLLLDKTGTITLGNRQATQFSPAPGVTAADLADAAQLASLADETPEGRSIVRSEERRV